MLIHKGVLPYFKPECQTHTRALAHHPSQPAYHRHGGGTYRKKLVFMGGSTTPTGEVGTVDVWQLNLPDFPPTRENDFEGAASSLIASVAAIVAALALAVLAA